MSDLRFTKPNDSAGGSEGSEPAKPAGGTATPPCYSCGKKRVRSACPSCGKVVCQNCAERPYEFCCDGKGPTKAVVEAVIIAADMLKVYQGDADKHRLLRQNEGRRVRITYEVLP